MQVDCRTSLQMCAAPDIHTLRDGRTFLPLYFSCSLSFMRLISTVVSKHFVFSCHKNDTSTLSLLKLDIVTCRWIFQMRCRVIPVNQMFAWKHIVKELLSYFHSPRYIFFKNTYCFLLSKILHQIFKWKIWYNDDIFMTSFGTLDALTLQVCRVLIWSSYF